MSNTYIIDDGRELFTFTNVNGDVICEFRFNPVDVSIAQRYKDMQTDFDFGEQGENESDIDYLNRIESICMEKVDFLLASDASKDIFAKVRPLTNITNGDFFIEAVLEMIGKIIEDKSGERLEKKFAKIKKATSKYKK